MVFNGGEGTSFLNDVQEVDNDPGVSLALKEGGAPFGPAFAAGATTAKTSNDTSRSVRAEGGRPGTADGLAEGRVEPPGTVVAKDW